MDASRVDFLVIFYPYHEGIEGIRLQKILEKFIDPQERGKVKKGAMYIWVQLWWQFLNKVFKTLVKLEYLVGFEMWWMSLKWRENNGWDTYIQDRSNIIKPKYTVNVLPVLVTVLISVNFQPCRVLVIFTAFSSTLTLSVKLGVQEKPVYIIGKLNLLINLYHCFFQWLILLMACDSYRSFSSKFSWILPWNVTIKESPMTTNIVSNVCLRFL